MSVTGSGESGRAQARAFVRQDDFDVAQQTLRVHLMPNRQVMRAWPAETSLFTLPEEEPGARRLTPPELPDGLTGSLAITEDEAYALYSALGEHFGHTTHADQTAREDLLAERRRVDKMLDHMMDRGRADSSRSHT